MTTTESVSTPQTAWSVVDVLFASAGTGGPQVTMWTQPHRSDAPDALQTVVRDHAEAVTDDGDWQPEAVTEHPDGCGGSYLTRAFTPRGQRTASARAAYWPTSGGVSVAMARGDAGQDLNEFVAELVSASRPRFNLTAEEVLAISEATGLAAPPVSATAYPGNASEEVRQAAHQAARASMLARGLFVPDGERLVPAVDLHAAFTLLVDGDRSLLVSKVRPEGLASTALLGGRDGVVAALAPSTPGVLELSTSGSRHAVARYAEWLAPQDDVRADGAEPFSAALDDVRICVGSVDGPEQLRGARSQISIRGLRRHGEDASSFEASWVEDAHGRLWSVTGSDDLSSAILSPTTGGAVADSLSQALDFSTS